MRSHPNIVITGTPGVGKTSHCKRVVERVAGLRHVSVTDVVATHACHDGWDAGRTCWIVDEDKVSYLCYLYPSPG